MIDQRSDCIKYGRHSHLWNFNDKTGIAKCKNCSAKLDTRARMN